MGQYLPLGREFLLLLSGNKVGCEAKCFERGNSPVCLDGICSNISISLFTKIYFYRVQQQSLLGEAVHGHKLEIQSGIGAKESMSFDRIQQCFHLLEPLLERG